MVSRKVGNKINHRSDNDFEKSKDADQNISFISSRKANKNNTLERCKNVQGSFLNSIFSTRYFINEKIINNRSCCLELT